ncbi:uncharacterized protein LOC136095773 [Hydra vulgaris]|uniref:uncharacterized protein LOC136095773 n=1 Tax=Hydra vulgaris TaxID=6087 RepID=UPI0032EA01AF
METEITDPIHQGDPFNFIDIGIIIKNNSCQVNSFLKITCFETPNDIVKDSNHHAFPYRFLNKSLANGETCKRDSLCWSVEKQSFSAGWGISRGWRRLKNRILLHESSIYHKENYVVWKSASRAALCETSVDNLLLSKLKTETENWKKLFQRILDVIIFFSERGLALFGSNQRIGDRANGNFLGIIELLSKYNPLLAEHVKHVRESQQCKQRMQAHYLSMRIQNEFIDICGSHFQTAILHEIVKD